MTLRRRGYLSEGIAIGDVGFVSGQEPDGLDDEFAADFEVTGSISGKTVAQLLGKQQRVLQKALEKMTSRQLVTLITGGRSRVSKEIVREAKKKIAKFVNRYTSREFGARGVIDTIDFAEDDQYFSVKVDPKTGTINFTVEFGVLVQTK